MDSSSLSELITQDAALGSDAAATANDCFISTEQLSAT